MIGWPGGDSKTDVSYLGIVFDDETPWLSSMPRKVRDYQMSCREISKTYNIVKLSSSMVPCMWMRRIESI